MTKFVACVSGKGGVGKTTTALNVGQALASLDKQVVVLDANLVTPNIALNLGYVNPEGTLNKFLRKEKSLKEIMYLHPSGISVIPASPSYAEFQNTNPQKISKIFEHLDNVADYVIVDSPSGLGYEVSEILRHCDEILVVINPQLSSVMDALKTIRLAQTHGATVSGIVLNKTSYLKKYEMKAEEIEEILGHQIIAQIRDNRKMKKAAHHKMPVHHLYPQSHSAKQFKNIARYVSHEDGHN